MRVAAVACLVAVAASGCRRAAEEDVKTSASVPVAVVAVRVGRIEGRLTAMGVVDPAPGGDWTIVAPQAGRVAEIPKSEGAAVAKGELLVRFEAPGLDADAAAKHSEFRQAETRLANARRASERVAGLFERGIAARKEVEESQKELQDAEAALAAADASRAASASLAALTVVRARFDGVVARRWHNPGDTVEAAASDPVLRVVDPSHMQVLAQVGAADAARIVRGRAASVHLAGGSGGAVPGRVIGSAGALDPATGTAPVRIDIEGRAPFAAGSPVAVDVVTEVASIAVVVPATAIVRDGEETLVLVAGTDGKAHRRAVTLGIANGEEVEVKTGLAGSERVIVRGQTDLPDGGAITVEGP